MRWRGRCLRSFARARGVRRRRVASSWVRVPNEVACTGGSLRGLCGGAVIIAFSTCTPVVCADTWPAQGPAMHRKSTPLTSQHLFSRRFILDRVRRRGSVVPVLSPYAPRAVEVGSRVSRACGRRSPREFPRESHETTGVGASVCVSEDGLLSHILIRVLRVAESEDGCGKECRPCTAGTGWSDVLFVLLLERLGTVLVERGSFALKVGSSTARGDGRLAPSDRDVVLSLRSVGGGG